MRTTWAAIALTVAAIAPRATVVQQGSISGVIVSDGTDHPVARAVVTLSAAALRPSLVTVTDAQGRFAFSNLPAGLYTASASKAAFISAVYGQTTPGRGSGVPIALIDGQQVTGLTWTLPRGAIIAGRVVDERGQAMRDVPMVLMRHRVVEGERSLEPMPCCLWPRTGADGSYRVYGLPPGEYLVSALPPGGYVYLPEPFVPSEGEARQTSAAEIAWALKELAGPSGPVEPVAGPNIIYSRQFFPGTSDPAGATPISVTAGEERSGIDFAMKRVPSARIEGRVVGPDNQPIDRPRISMSGSSTSAPGSTFVRRNLPPGRYTISVHGSANALWGRAVVDLNGQDVLGLEIRLEPSAKLSGRVAFESVSDAPAPPNPASVRISLRPSTSGLTQVAVQPGGTFTVAGAEPGRYRLHAAIAQTPGATASTWVLKSAVLNGRDISDEAFAIAAGEQLEGAVVTFTDRATELAGTLFDGAGRPAPGFHVVAFSTDRAHWVQNARRLPAPSRSATDGTFRFAGLPAGAYHLAAVTGVEPTDLADARFLDELARHAVVVQVLEGRRTTQDLRFRTGGS